VSSSPVETVWRNKLVTQKLLNKKFDEAVASYNMCSAQTANPFPSLQNTNRILALAMDAKPEVAWV
jgi:hypothetical protein